MNFNEDPMWRINDRIPYLEWMPYLETKVI